MRLTKKQTMVECKWIFQKNVGVHAIENLRFKTSHVAKDFTQVEEIDHNAIFLKGTYRNCKSIWSRVRIDRR